MGQLRTGLLLVGLTVAGVGCSGSSSSSSTTSVTPAETTAASAALTTVPVETTAAPSPTEPVTTPAPTIEPAPEPTEVAAVDVPMPTIDGPIESATPQSNASIVDLATAGYTEEEFFLGGDASSYKMVGDPTDDGRWAAEPDDTAPFVTRAIVRRPTDAAAFSGTVVVEWLNVSAGFDGDPDWGYLHDELIREGHIWVGVSVQQVGLESLVTGVADRYGTLRHPGDRYSFSIFSQAGMAARGALTPGYEVKHVIGAGESQSAIFMTTYLNAIEPLGAPYDGYLVHSRGGRAPSLDNPKLRSADDAATPIIRTDRDVPVMVFITETDLTVLRYAEARQDDEGMVKVWEVAGTAHADAYLIEKVYGVTGDASGLLNCKAPLNSGPQHEVLQAAFHHLVAWVAEGAEPPTSPRLEVAGEPVAVVRDERGNAVGGIRTGPVEAPVATLSGDPAPGNEEGFCFLFGSTVPFDAATLSSLYTDHDDYVAKFTAATNAAVDAGFLLRVDADAMIATAEASTVVR